MVLWVLAKIPESGRQKRVLFAVTWVKKQDIVVPMVDSLKTKAHPNPEFLRVQFGHSQFQGVQEGILDLLFQGQSVLGLMPTGSGKSLCYQYFAKASEGLVLVVSPLIALMEDQTKHAKEMGIQAACLHSAMPAQKKDWALKAVKENRIRLLFLTPERFRRENLWEALDEIPISLFAVDEAHCISQWGNDFRPEYSRLGEIRKKLGEPLTVALTATATPFVQEDICNSLRISQKNIRKSSMARPNLFLAVEELYGREARVKALVDLLKDKSETTLVYFSLISTLMNVAQDLERSGMRPTIYHGQLPDSLRKKNQNLFLSGEAPLLLATPAFGLGVHKVDIRRLVHFEMPNSIESYFQEVGRAGRDGLLSHCHLFYDENDIATQMEFVRWANPEGSFVKNVVEHLSRDFLKWKQGGLEEFKEKLVFKNKRDYRLETTLNILERSGALEKSPRGEWLSFHPEEVEPSAVDTPKIEARYKFQLQKLQSLVQWIHSEECRTQGIFAYFSETWPGPCGNCDHCE